MNPDHQTWQRLAAFARNHVDERDTAAPMGFATRVVALALAFPPARPRADAACGLAFRAMMVAGFLMLAALLVNFSTVTSLFASDNTPPSDDPVSDLISIAS